MPTPAAFANFDVAASIVSLWLFKKSTNGSTTYTGRSVDTDGGLDEALKDVVVRERARITEVSDYTLLAQPNENSALTIDAVETDAALIIEAMAEQRPNRRVTALKHVQNTEFYAIKLVHNDDAIFALKKTDGSWQTRRTRNAIDVVFHNLRMGIENDPSFSVSRYVDCVIAGEEILIANKLRFESIFNYKRAHDDDFLELQKEPQFTELFSTVGPLVDYVGQNKIHLRRVCAIRMKAHYRDAAFMGRLRQRHHQFGLNLQFDATGKIVPTPETCQDVIRALLDHRLQSPFSTNVYDVDDAVPVG